MRDLIHSGVAHDDNPPGRGSGRFGWGTGENPGQHQYNFIHEVELMKKKGLKDSEIAVIMLGEKARGIDLKAQMSIYKKELRKINYQKALQTLDECKGNKSEAARKMGISASSFNSLIDPILAERNDRYENTAQMLRDAVAAHVNDKSKGMIDVGKDVGQYLNGVPDSTKDVAIKMLQNEGYVKSYVKVPQKGTKHETSVMVLAPPGTTISEIQQNRFNIESVATFTPDKGKTWFVPEPPASIDGKRVMIRYAEDGGKALDGTIEFRRGVPDLSLGDSTYAQVRVAVDDKLYMKGMAMYSPDESAMPKGVDVIFNTHHPKGTPREDVLKVLKGLTKDENGNITGTINQDNPFGALIMAGGQYHYKDSSGKEHLSPVNKLREEGEWDNWSRTIASQFLSKQPIKIIKNQLGVSMAYKRSDLDDILNLTNPIVKQHMLNDYADACDRNAADLAAKGFKDQAFQVLLPVPSLKDTEIYAPRFKDGEQVALCRYPHGATFEIPVLTVNNKNKAGKTALGDARDAVGVNANVLDQLSGADCDGDTAVVIPMKTNRVSFSHEPKPPEIKGFDTELYKLPDDAPPVKHDYQQKQMGVVTNLITDMTAAGATTSEVVRAVKHSMVVIDSEKHHLNMAKSAEDNRIHELKIKYQGEWNDETGRWNTGAGTILSRAGADVHVNQRKEVTNTKIMTPEELKRWNRGDKVYRDTGKTSFKLVTDPKDMTPEELTRYNAGKKVYRETDTLVTEKVSRMSTVDDAMDLVHDKANEKEVAYAQYANYLKDLAREARREARSIKPTPVDKGAKEAYAKEVESINKKIKDAEANNPKERKAQAIANSITTEVFKANPEMDKEHRERENARAIAKARAMVGAHRDKIVLTDKEWDAIQANAISTEKLRKIMRYSDSEALKKRATPKETKGLSDSKKQLLISLSHTNMTAADLAERFGISVSTVYSILKAA